ncbi:MAG: DUF5050 domain-containing protein [Acidobacteria bacterium]|nr:DUF5050 domain-containing protein [Acidobacteriota bacterium]
MRLKRLLLGASICLVPAMVQAQAPTKIYWTESYPSGTHPVSKANLDGSSPQELCTSSRGFTGVAVDPVHRKLYLAGWDKIERADLDGSNRQDLVTSIYPEDLDLDLLAGKMYWTNYTYDDATIMRANLDGSGVETLTGHLGDGCVLTGIDVDAAGGKVYWVERFDDQIMRANLDGSGMETLLRCSDGVSNSYDVVIYGSYLYWTDWNYGICRAELDGDNPQAPYISGLNDPLYIDVDRTNGKFYWASYGDDSIKRCNHDGTGMETLVTGILYPQAVCLSAESLSRRTVPILQMLLLEE